MACVEDQAFVRAEASLLEESLFTGAPRKTLSDEAARIIQTTFDELGAQITSLSEARCSVKGVANDLRRTIVSGNADFAGIYAAVWARIYRTDQRGLGVYKQAVNQVSLPGHGTTQVARTIVELLSHAVQVHKRFQKFMVRQTQGQKRIRCRVPDTLKTVERIAEKVFLSATPGLLSCICECVCLLLKFECAFVLMFVSGPLSLNSPLMVALSQNSHNCPIYLYLHALFPPQRGAWNGCMSQHGSRCGNGTHFRPGDCDHTRSQQRPI